MCLGTPRKAYNLAELIIAKALYARSMPIKKLLGRAYCYKFNKIQRLRGHINVCTLELYVPYRQTITPDCYLYPGDVNQRRNTEDLEQKGYGG